MDPGTALAVTSLTFQVFAGCIRGFVLLSTAQNLGSDASLLRTQLGLEEWHFVQWAEKVGLIGKDGKLEGRGIEEMDPRINEKLALKLMFELEALLGRDKIRSRYKMDLVVERPAEAVVDGKEDEGCEREGARGVLGGIISNDVRGEILARVKLIQSKNHLPKRLWWAAVDRSKFEALVRDVRAIVQGLWALLNPIQQEDLQNRIESILSVVIRVNEDVRDLRELGDVLRRNDGAEMSKTVGFAEAAELKAVGIEISSKELGVGWSDAQITRRHGILPTKDRTAKVLRPLQIEKLTGVQPHQKNKSIGIGYYDHKPVFVETKTVEPFLRSKLKDRVDNLAILLSTSKDASFHTLQCLGVIEIPNESQFVFVYDYPNLDILEDKTNLPQPISLLDLLNGSQPSVTYRLNLATALLRTINIFHTGGWLHKDLRSENILFFPTSSTSHPLSSNLTPYLTGFQFSRLDNRTEISENPSSNPSHDIYRHRNALGEPSMAFEQYMDIYSLGTILIEIAEWRPLRHVVLKHVDVKSGGVPLDKLAGIGKWLNETKVESGMVAFRMGDAFARAVKKCLGSGDGEGEGSQVEDGHLDTLGTIHELSKCII